MSPSVGIFDELKVWMFAFDVSLGWIKGRSKEKVIYVPVSLKKIVGILGFFYRFFMGLGGKKMEKEEKLQIEKESKNKNGIPFKFFVAA